MMNPSSKPRLGIGSTLAMLLFVSVLAAQAPIAQSPQPSKIGNPGLYEGLREIINRGAELYNRGDPNSCYRLFEGALRAFRTDFAGDQEIVRQINAGLADAERRPYAHERAQALRHTLDGLLARAAPARAPRAGLQPPAGYPSLWQRLGGEINIRRVVDDFVALAGADFKVDFTRGGRFRLDDAKLARLKKELIDFISQATGGPYAYTGRSMKAAHQGMAITNAQFDASLADLRSALQKNGAAPADIDLVLRAAEATRSDIVESSPPVPSK
jgi:hemoglobin